MSENVLFNGRNFNSERNKNPSERAGGNLNSKKNSRGSQAGPGSHSLCFQLTLGVSDWGTGGGILADHLTRRHRELLDRRLCRPDSEQWP